MQEVNTLKNLEENCNRLIEVANTLTASNIAKHIEDGNLAEYLAIKRVQIKTTAGDIRKYASKK